MQGVRLGGVINCYSGGLLSSVVQVRGKPVGGRSGVVTWSYLGGFLSLVVLEGPLR